MNRGSTRRERLPAISGCKAFRTTVLSRHIAFYRTPKDVKLMGCTSIYEPIRITFQLHVPEDSTSTRASRL